MTQGQFIVLTSGVSRGAARHTLRMVASGKANDEPDTVKIVNLSTTGLLIETTARLAMGESLQVELPHAGMSAATVVWSSGNFFGCRFKKPLSSAAVSAALLKSEPASPALADDKAEALAELPFPARLRRLRELHGWSLEKLAADLGVSRQTVWYWERGRNMPGQDNFIRLAQVFGVREQDLLPERTGLALQQTVPLAVVVEARKAEIAELAGTTQDQVHITIKF